MKFYVLKIVGRDQIPEDHPMLEIPNFEEFVGAWIVDIFVDEDPNRITVTQDLLGEARRFETEGLALAFARIGDMKVLPMQIQTVEQINPEKGKDGASDD